jgi:hypothetical protein
MFSALPMCGVGDSIFLMLFKNEIGAPAVAALLGCFNSLVIDFATRQKFGGTNLSYYILKQLPILPLSTFGERELTFIGPRVLELTYTAWDLQPFAQDLGYEGDPYPWYPERRAQLRAELDAYYAYLYGLSKKELRYILDPKDVMGEDYPSETFRVLKEREIKEHGLDEKGMWRTQRLVLDAYDRFANDATFDASRLEDPEYFPVVRAALAVSKSREQEMERTLRELVDRTDRAPLPTLFVEGETDRLIVEGAWRALYPGDEQARSIDEEDAPATPEHVVLDGRAGDVIGAVHRVGGAVPGLGRRAGGVFLQVVDDAVVPLPGVGIIRLRRAGIAVVDVDLGVSDRGQAGIRT